MLHRHFLSVLPFRWFGVQWMEWFTQFRWRHSVFYAPNSFQTNLQKVKKPEFSVSDIAWYVMFCILLRVPSPEFSDGVKVWKSGMIPALLYMIICCALSGYITQCIVVCAELNECRSFIAMATKLFGARFSIFIQFCLLVLLWMACISYSLVLCFILCLVAILCTVHLPTLLIFQNVEIAGK